MGDVRHESLLHPASIALEVGDRVDGLWMAWEGGDGLTPFTRRTSSRDLLY
jgi:hypothetical protein